MLRLALLLLLAVPAAALGQPPAFDGADVLTRLPTYVGGYDLIRAQEVEEGGAPSIQAEYARLSDSSDVGVFLLPYSAGAEEIDEMTAPLERADLAAPPGDAVVYAYQEGRRHGYIAVDAGADLVLMASSGTYGVELEPVLLAVLTALREAPEQASDEADPFRAFQRALPARYAGRALEGIIQLPPGSTSPFGLLSAPDSVGPWSFLASYRPPGTSRSAPGGLLVARFPEGEALGMETELVMAMEGSALRTDTTVTGVPVVLVRAGEFREEAPGASVSVSLDAAALIVPVAGYRLVLEGGEETGPATLIAFAEALDLAALRALPPPRVRPKAPPLPEQPPGWGNREDLLYFEQDVIEESDSQAPPPPPPPPSDNGGA